MLGTLDFFAVLLPGAIATWLGTQYVPEDMRGAFRIAGNDVSVAHWIVFVLTAYALGHFVFLLGSRLDTTYDLFRKRLRPPESDRPFQAASQLQERLTPELGDFTTFKWARSYVGIHAPQARVEIDRLEAHSKFFRGFVVISVALYVHFIWHGQVGLALTAAVVGALSFWRFSDQRYKMTEIAYATAVIVYETKAKPTERRDTSEEGAKEEDTSERSGDASG
jgi:hypothetical protein